jgi:hypothetical protein
MLRPVGVLMVHYTGVKDRAGKPDIALAQQAADYGAHAGKTWEYNYMIGRNGWVFEQAGRYKAAHCLNHNDDSIGVLCLVGIGYPTPGEPGAARDHLAEAFRALRYWLVEQGRLLAIHTVEPHYGWRSTACPGPLAGPPGEPKIGGGPEGRSGDVCWPFTVLD